MTCFAFTAASLRTATRSAPAGATTTLRDATTRGLILRGSPKGWSWGFEKRMDGHLHRATLGRLDETPNLAAAIHTMREAAAARAATIRRGDDPDHGKADHLISEALRQPTRYWLERWGTTVRASTRIDAESTLRRLDLLGRPLLTMTRAQVSALYEQQRAMVSERTGKLLSSATVAKMFRVLRLLHNYATASYPERAPPPPNPVSAALKGGRGRGNRLFPAISKRTHIDGALLPAFVAELRRRAAVAGSGLAVRWQAAEMIALTGMRLREVTDMLWSEVDLEGRTFTIGGHRSKNGEPLTRFITPRLAQLFYQRAAERRRDAIHVFESAAKPGTAIWNVGDEVRAAALAIGAGPRTAHDLRRSYISVASNLRIPPSVRRMLVNHISGGDVHDGYVQVNDAELRAASLEIETAIIGGAAKRSRR